MSVAKMEPSIPIDPNNIPEDGIAVFANLDQDWVIAEMPPGVAQVAIDPVPAAPDVHILTVRDPAAPDGYRVASIALDVKGLLTLYTRTRLLLREMDERHQTNEPVSSSDTTDSV